MLPSFCGICLKKLSTLPPGAQVGPSVKYPSAISLYSDPSGLIKPIKNLPLVNLVNAI